MTDTSAHTTHTDLVSDGWIDRRMPTWTRPYLKLARLDRPTGIWLLLLPCWWSIALASPSAATGIGMTVLFTIGAIVMRGAGCTVNDILDRDIDAQVERTRGRPLPSGQVGLLGALVFLALQLAVGLVILIQLSRLTIGLGVASLVLVGAYPLMKRITWWPQAFLGLTFNWGAIMGWSAVTGHIGVGAILLYAGGFCWTMIYDTIYAHQDSRDDAEAGVKSTARRFGRFSRLWLFGFAAAMLILVDLAGDVTGLHSAFQFMQIPIAAHLIWLLALWDVDDPRDCLRRFQASRWTGLLVVAAIVVGRLFG
ncbi:MAG TPA: 4-hydroxybenzoate octaprenyltransferase [Alphaproteobacteria bacterium]|nr:4-hydroxybenzoate octaprenyltransferase [Alphaproteobacteria bacterium]